MKILIVNDDGMHAAGLVPLIRWARKLGEVTVAVPQTEQSGMGHSVKFMKAFEAKEVSIAPDVTVWAVDSTPADCVRFGILALKQTYDLVLSGVNRGMNMGTDILYSGTVGAASEAVNLSHKTLSVSTDYPGYADVTAHLDEVWDFVQKHQLLAIHDAYNINIPHDGKAIRIVHHGGHYYGDAIEPLGDGRYQPVGLPMEQLPDDLSLDIVAAKNGYITVMPLTIDRTCLAVYEQLRHLNS